MKHAGAIVALSLAIACAEAPRGGTVGGNDLQAGEDVVGPDVAATVDGHGIARATVIASAQAAGVEPTVALRRLEDEALLAQAAAEAGFADDPDVERASRQALVQALLARTAEAHDPNITDAQVEAAFESNLERWESPETRASQHLLVRVAEDAPEEAQADARRTAEDHLSRLRGSMDAAAALRAMQRRAPADDGILVEDVPALSRRGQADPAYLAALFGAPGPGLVPEVTRSSFGYHVIVLAEIAPAMETPREEALATLRAELEAQARSRWTLAWIQQLVARHPVSVRPDVHAHLAAMGAP
ncbi:MAG: peptidylprolyl isomerase [Sandaracinaceae bacterium]